jgi:hypothetical protein
VEELVANDRVATRPGTDDGACWLKVDIGVAGLLEPIEMDSDKLSSTLIADSTALVVDEIAMEDINV